METINISDLVKSGQRMRGQQDALDYKHSMHSIVRCLNDFTASMLKIKHCSRSVLPAAVLMLKVQFLLEYYCSSVSGHSDAAKLENSVF